VSKLDVHERSRSGSPIIRHQAPVRGLRSVAGDEAARAALVAHVDKHLGPADQVFHEIVSELVHVDVHVIAPQPGRDHFTLYTTGMSEKSMIVPDGVNDPRYAELMIALPRGWKLSQADFKDERNYWPVRWLKLLTRLPHRYATWLAWGHTVPNGEPPEPFAKGTDLCCLLVTPPLLVDPSVAVVELEDKRVHFYSLIPLYKEELMVKLDQGLERLEEMLQAANVTELLDPQRKSVCRTDPA
jgi:hypothetical protein